MKAAELIAKLQTLPPDAEVWHLWDGALRTRIDYVWVTREGYIGTGQYGEVCYREAERPTDAPSVLEDEYWRLPENPHPDILNEPDTGAEPEDYL